MKDDAACSSSNDATMGTRVEREDVNIGGGEVSGVVSGPKGEGCIQERETGSKPSKAVLLKESDEVKEESKA